MKTASYTIDQQHLLKVRKPHLRDKMSSNTNTTVYVFKIGEKLPLFGTSFNDKTPLDEIKYWANQKIQTL